MSTFSFPLNSSGSARLRPLSSLTWTPTARDRLPVWIGWSCIPVHGLHARLTHPPARHSSHIIAREWAKIRLDSSIIPTQEEHKKNETRGKLKDYTIWPYLAARVCMCVSVYMHVYSAIVSFMPIFINNRDITLEGFIYLFF